MKDERTKRPNQQMHPNSLKNLRPIPFSKDDPEAAAKRANEMREKGLETRRKRKELLGEFKEIAGEMKEIPAVDVLRVMLAKALEADDQDTVAHLANLIAPYESPKLSSVNSTEVKLNANDLTDAELEAKAKELGIDVKDLIDKRPN